MVDTMTVTNVKIIVWEIFHGGKLTVIANFADALSSLFSLFPLFVLVSWSIIVLLGQSHCPRLSFPAAGQCFLHEVHLKTSQDFQRLNSSHNHNLSHNYYYH